MPAVLKPYAKAVLPFVCGLALIVLGTVIGDDTLKAIGVGSILASPLVYRVPNKG
jgi:hypothetical protein